MAKHFHRSRVGVGMNRYGSGCSVKRIERSYRLDTSLIIFIITYSSILYNK